MFSRTSLLFAASIALAISACEPSGAQTKQEVSGTPPDTHPEMVEVKAKRIRKPLIPIPDSCPKERYVYLSWNLHDFGKSKSSDTLELMAEIGREADFIAGQEVNAGSRDNRGDGPQTVAKLADIQSRKGEKWDYAVSDRTVSTSGSITERYAYWWKASKAMVNRRNIRLVKDLEESVEREPYAIVFHTKKGAFKAFSVHTVPTAKNPIREAEALAKSGELRIEGNMILSGDFNLSGKDTDPILGPLGFVGHIAEKTSLKQKVGKKGEHRYMPYDNIYTKGDIKVCASGVVDFPKEFFSPLSDASLKEAREVSDHLPVYIVFYFP